MKTLKIYDPALCCSTGVCGPGVDPELVRVSKTIDRLKAMGEAVERYNLSQDPGAYVANPVISRILQEDGDGGLPVTLLNDEVVKSGAYLTNAEFCKALGLPEDTLESGSTGNRCGGGSGCC